MRKNHNATLDREVFSQELFFADLLMHTLPNVLANDVIFESRGWPSY